MAEYREPDDDIDDLMGDDDDDDEYTEDQETELLNVEDLVNSRKEEKSSKPTRDAGDELLFLSANIGLNDSDDSDEDMDKAADTAAERRADEVTRRAKLRERFNVLPPGINLFPDDKIQESKSNGYHYFNLDTLDLEKDFSYNRRGQLKVLFSISCWEPALCHKTNHKCPEKPLS